MTRLRGFNNMYTCEWNQASFAPDLEENHISAVLTISKSKLPKMSLDFYLKCQILEILLINLGMSGQK